MRLAIKDHIRESRLFNERAAVALAIFLLLLLSIVARLFYLQVMSHEHYVTLADQNRITLIATPPTRGFIYDRNGVLLAQTLPSFSVELTPEQVPDIDKTLEYLKELIAVSDSDITRFQKQLKQNRPFSSIPLRFHLSDEEIARIAVNRHRLPGVEIEVRAIRHYPQGALAAHAIGYVARISEDELQGTEDPNYDATSFVGKLGVEKAFEDILHGKVGFKQIETNALGRSLRTLTQTPATPGKDIYVTIDAKLQSVAEKAFGDRRGALVAIDPRDGEILALVSMPGYDPNPFVVGIDTQAYNALQTSLDKPLFNRALKGQYPPGSTLKPFIGLDGLDSGKVTINTSFYCPGWFTLEGDTHRYRDWKEQGHGTTTLDKAIVESCDVYFYNLALTLGIDRMQEFLQQFGFGKRTGVDLPDEAFGLLPSRQWKQRSRHQPWYPGETLITGIGQGYFLVTPLQLAAATATLANRGVRIEPHIAYAVHDPGNGDIVPVEPKHAGEITVARPTDWEDIISSMERVVHSAHGTAQATGRIAKHRIAGKTGTAQVFGIKQDEQYEEKDLAERLRDHALFIALSPPENPQIALALIVENGGHGSSAAAPIAQKVIDAYLEEKKP
jgi:penicillin-binding protein 2